tara:strand:+ start:1251 stop:2033 length:783 start_codon:yes stop_codon:yes gene_type:complete
MYAYGVYPLSGPLRELLQCDTNLNQISDSDLFAAQVLDPLFEAVKSWRSGVYTEYQAKEVFNQRVEQVSEDLHAVPSWEEACEEGLLYQYTDWMHETSSWTVFFTGHFPCLTPDFLREIDWDPFLLIEHLEGDLILMKDPNCYGGTVTVIRSGEVALREGINNTKEAADVEAANATKEGITPTYVLPERMERELLEIAAESARCSHFWRDANPTDDEIIEEIEHEIGFVPGTLSAATQISVSSDSSTTRLDESQTTSHGG